MIQKQQKYNNTVEEEIGHIQNNSYKQQFSNDIGQIFYEAIISNTNLGGDNINRGILLGTLLGLLIGESNIPKYLITDLYRYKELTSIIDKYIDMIMITLKQSTIDTNKAEIFPFYGQPSVFPFVPYPKESNTYIQYPKDFSHKYTQLHNYIQQLQNKYGYLSLECFQIPYLRFFRSTITNPFLIVSKHEYTILQKEIFRLASYILPFIMIPNYEHQYGLISYSALVSINSIHESQNITNHSIGNILENGEASKDRKEVLQTMELKFNNANSTNISVSTDNSHSLPYGLTNNYLLETAKYIDNHKLFFRTKNTLNKYSSLLITSNYADNNNIINGTGIFIYANPIDLHHRLLFIEEQRQKLLKEQNLSILSNNSYIIDNDPINFFLSNEYQVKLNINYQSTYLFSNKNNNGNSMIYNKEPGSCS